MAKKGNNKANNTNKAEAEPVVVTPEPTPEPETPKSTEETTAVAVKSETDDTNPENYEERLAREEAEDPAKAYIACLHAAELLESNGVLDKAEYFYNRALVNVRTKLQKEDAEKATNKKMPDNWREVEEARVLVRQGICYRKLNLIPAAENSLRAAVRLQPSHEGFTALCGFLYDLQRWPEFRTESDKWRESIRQRKIGDDSVEWYSFVMLQGRAQFSRKKLDQAERFFKDALRIQEKMLGAKNRALREVLCSLSDVARARSKFTEAETYLLRALDIFREAELEDQKNKEKQEKEKAALPAPSTPTPAPTPAPKEGKDKKKKNNNNKDTTKSAEEPAQAEPTATTPSPASAPSAPASTGAQYNPQVASIHGKLADLYAQTARVQEAEMSLTKCLSLHTPDNHGAILINLARLKSAQGRLPEALECSKKSIAANDEAFGKNHPRSIQPRLTYADLLTSDKRWTEACAVLEEARVIAATAFGTNSEQAATLLARVLKLRKLIKITSDAAQEFGDANPATATAITTAALTALSENQSNSSAAKNKKLASAPHTSTPSNSSSAPTTATATATTVQACQQCGTSEKKAGEFKRCAQCHTVCYCTKDCQKAHWKVHKKDCAKAANANAATQH